MKFKHSLLIFLVGILVGISLSPLANAKPRQFFQAPITVTLAEETGTATGKEQKVSGQVLGAAVEDKQTLRRQVMSDLLARQDNEMQIQEEDDNDLKVNNFKGKFSIAVYGDSMVDTMETGLPYLAEALQKYYPQAKFELFNYGIGAETIEKGEARFNTEYDYKDRHYPAITALGAGLIIIESFAYNPLAGDDAGLNQQWQSLSRMVEQAKASGSQVMLLATIAPSKSQFGQGPGGVNWPSDQAWQHATLINRYLENSVRLGESLNLPVIDAYHNSLLTDGEGISSYISSHDHIHPSPAGHRFISELIAAKLLALGAVR